MSGFDFFDCPECSVHVHAMPREEADRGMAWVAKVGLKSAGEQVAELAKMHAEAFKVPYNTALQHVLRNAPNLAQAYLDERRAVQARPGAI